MGRFSVCGSIREVSGFGFCTGYGNDPSSVRNNSKRLACCTGCGNDPSSVRDNSERLACNKFFRVLRCCFCPHYLVTVLGVVNRIFSVSFGSICCLQCFSSFTHAVDPYTHFFLNSFGTMARTTSTVEERAAREGRAEPGENAPDAITAAVPSGAGTAGVSNKKPRKDACPIREGFDRIELWDLTLCYYLFNSDGMMRDRVEGPCQRRPDGSPSDLEMCLRLRREREDAGLLERESYIYAGNKSGNRQIEESFPLCPRERD